MMERLQESCRILIEVLTCGHGYWVARAGPSLARLHTTRKLDGVNNVFTWDQFAFEMNHPSRMMCRAFQ